MSEKGTFSEFFKKALTWKSLHDREDKILNDRGNQGLSEYWKEDEEGVVSLDVYRNLA